MDKQNTSKQNIDILLDFLESIKNNSYIEFIIYIPIILAVTIIAILIKPTLLTFIIAAFLAIAYIIIILSYSECNKSTAKDNIIFIIITICFTLFCILLYYLINTIYWKYPQYHSLLLLMPIIYFILIKLIFYIFDCDQYSNYHFGINLITTLLKFLFK
jgi:hypothetical protein